MPKKITLASASPRRERLLKQIGLDFQVIPSNVDEDTFDHNDPLIHAQILALRKAKDLVSHIEYGIIIGADTQVLADDEVLGKPVDDADAVRMLSKLQGKTHKVITGVALIDTDSGIEETWVETTKVTFREISDDEIIEYVKTGEPMGKAGAYGIQGIAAAFVERIEGCYFNVVGLPLAKLSQRLRSLDKGQGQRT